MTDRMTDERITEFEWLKDAGNSTFMIDRAAHELLQALKAERKRTSELKATEKRIRDIPVYDLDDSGKLWVKNIDLVMALSQNSDQ